MQLVKFPDAGVPRAGVTKVALVANTAAPEPVSSDRAVFNCALLNDPRTAALPLEVTCPVRLALVVTVPAVRLDAVPDTFVITPDAGVPRAGVTRVGLVANTAPPVPVSSVNAARRFALVEVPRNVATLEARLVIPVPPLATGSVPLTPVVKATSFQAGTLLVPVFARY